MRELLLSIGLLVLGLVSHARASEIPLINFDSLVLAVSDVESGGHPDTVGQAGERGLMQIKSGTWEDMTTREFGEAISFDRAFEPDLNLMVGRAYLRHLSEQLAASPVLFEKGGFLPVLVACYNRGPQCVADMGYSLAGLSPEAASYVERVLNLQAIYASEDIEPPLVRWALAAQPVEEAAPPPETVTLAQAEGGDAAAARDLMRSFSDVISICLRVIPLSFTGMVLVCVRRNRRLREIESAFLGSLTLPRLRLPSREKRRRA